MISNVAVVVWRNGSSLISINEVNLRQTRLVSEWVTVSVFNSHDAVHLSQYVTSHLGQLSLAIPLWVGVMSSSQRAVTPCGCVVKADMVWVAGILYDPIVTHGPYLSL